MPARPVPPGTRITQVYDEADGELLILGEPGAGKTTLLLELARELLARAEQESSHLMPVVLNLSSWAVKRQPLAVWLVEELNAKYQVPRRVGQVWIDADQILPLLDGLDEVAQAHRSACVDTINAYRHEHGLVPMVICSRRVEYVAQETQVLLHRAVMVQPLTKQQIDEYLSNIGEPLAGLQTALRHDPTLQELTTTPFMLNVLVLTYQDVPVEDLVQEACLPDRQAKIFEHYVARMLRHRGAERRYTPEQTTRWLSWLARQLRRHNETEFYLEHLQRDWLPKPQERIYQFCLGLVFGGTVGLFVTLIYMAAYLFDWTIGGWFGKVAVPAFLGVFAAVVLLLLYGVLFPWLDTGEPWSNPATLSNSSWRISRLRLATLFKNRIFYGLSIGLLHGWFLSYYNIWLPYVVLNGLVFGIGYALVGRVDGSIHPAEIVGWSWRSRQKQLIGGLLIGLLFGLASNPHQLFIYALYYKAIPHSYLFDRSEITYILLIGATTGLGIGIIFALISCISNETLEKNKHVRPNQGIHRSVRNSIFLGLVSGIFAGLLTALILGPIESWILSYSLSTFSFNNSPYQTYSPIGVCWGIAVGIAVAVVVALRNGGVACLQHALLRLLLWHAGSIPWNYPRFLDYTVERIFLRRIGGGYIFVHRLLLEYFASLDSIPPLKEAKVQKQLAEPTP